MINHGQRATTPTAAHHEGLQLLPSIAAVLVPLVAAVIRRVRRAHTTRRAA